MDDLVYPRERVLGKVTLVLGVLVWLALIFGTFGIALIWLLVGFIIYLFAQSALIAHIRGNGVELSEAQFPDLYAQFVGCCDRLQIKKRPQVYILNGNGTLNAFATNFLSTDYVVLMSNVVDAMDHHADGVRFYMGHELGHLRMKHLSGHLLRWPVLWLPLLGAAYSRARESTCDRHGLACSGTADGAAHALAALSAGAERWKRLNINAYTAQTKYASGFWMSFHELTAAYPWLTKRASRVLDPKAPLPKRNGFAYIPALFIPYTGRLGAGFGFLILVYIIFILAAIAIPAYQDYTVKAKLSAAVVESTPTRSALTEYYSAHHAVPKTLADIGAPQQLADGSRIALNADNMVLTVTTKQGELIFTPLITDDKRLVWRCENGAGIKSKQLPPSCRNLHTK